MCGAVVPTRRRDPFAEWNTSLNPRCVGRLFQQPQSRKTVEISCLNPRCVGRLFQQNTNNTFLGKLSLNPRCVGRLFQLLFTYNVKGKGVLIPDVWGGCSNGDSMNMKSIFNLVLIPDVWGGCSNEMVRARRTRWHRLNPRCVGRLFQPRTALVCVLLNSLKCLNPRCVGRLFQRKHPTLPR